MTRWPSPEDEEAFVLPEHRATIRREPPFAPPELRKDEVARLRAERGLRTDSDSVARAIECSPRVTSLPLTREEREEEPQLMLMLRGVRSQSSLPEPLASLRREWRDGRAVVRLFATRREGLVIDELKRELGDDRVIVDLCRFSHAELHAIEQRLIDDVNPLERDGIDLLSITVTIDTIEVEFFAADRDAADRYLRERYGETLCCSWSGRSRMRETPHPFASWVADDRNLTVFYAIDLNGQAECGCRATEHPDRVVVELTILQPQGVVTLKGGRQSTHAMVALDAPVGERSVIDASAGSVRPRWNPQTRAARADG